jgi:acetyl-CoA C-acetyltransferase
LCVDSSSSFSFLTQLPAYADAGVEPIDFPIAPTVALPKALEKAKLTIDDIALFEINEAFSVVVRIAEQVMKIDPAKINVNGQVALQLHLFMFY